MEEQNQAEAGSSAGPAMAAMASTAVLSASRLQKASEGVGMERAGGNRDQARLSCTRARWRRAQAREATRRQASVCGRTLLLLRPIKKYHRKNTTETPNFPSFNCLSGGPLITA